LVILRGKPQVAVHCQRCNAWFISDKVTYQDETTVCAETYGDKTHIKEMLRCDALAPHLIVAKTRGCKNCSTFVDAVLCDTGPHGRFDVYLRTILEHQIKDPFSDIYMKSGLPAYTMQRRCGADTELRELYLQMRPDAKEKVAKYLEKRTREQEQFQRRNPGSSAKRTYD
jgi:hypothetical protein